MNEIDAPSMETTKRKGMPAVILAGGLSSRMNGREKTLLDLCGAPLIAHAIRRLRPQTCRIAINANGDVKRFQAFALPVIRDETNENLGPLAGILASLRWAGDMGYSFVVTVAGDTPFFPLDLVERLLSATESQHRPIALAATYLESKGLTRHPIFGIWDTSLADDLQSGLDSGIRKVVHWADQHDAISVEFGVGPPDPFFNVNRPEDLAAAATLQSQIDS